MRVLLDESLPRQLRRVLAGHEVSTVPEVGWAGKKNGELLRLAEPGFDVFVTMDRRHGVCSPAGLRAAGAIDSADAMKLQGSHTFDAPRQVVWEALLDPEVLAKTLPGITRLERTGGDRFEASMNIKVGPVQGKFDGHVELSDLDPPNGYRLALEGKGAPGFVNGGGAITLSDAEGGGTRLDYDLDVQVGGRLAGVGQRLLETTAKSLSRQAIESLGRLVTARAEAAESGAPAAEVAAPKVSDFAAGVTRDLASDLVPRRLRPWLIAALLAVVAVVIILLRGC